MIQEVGRKIIVWSTEEKEKRKVEKQQEESMWQEKTGYVAGSKLKKERKPCKKDRKKKVLIK